MLTNALNRQVFLWLLVFIAGITAAVARAASYWPHRASNAVGYQPALVNNRTQFSQQPVFRAGVNNNFQPAKYGQVHLNHSRPSWQQPQLSNYAPYPSHIQQGNFNRIPSNYVPYPAYGQHASLNQTRPSNYPYQSRPSALQPIAPNYPQYPAKGQYGTLNQTRPVWSQPSAPQLPNYPAQATNSRPWPSSAHQTNLYPILPNAKLAPFASGKTSQPGGQAVLSYGPGQY